LKNFKPIKIANPAKNDLRDIANYALKEWGKAQKKTYLNLFKQSFLALSHNNNDENVMPLGKPRQEIGTGLSSYRIKEHVVYFRETEREFLIIRILHSRMDPEKHLQ
jgi:toxin ParE1/3/4